MRQIKHATGLLPTIVSLGGAAICIWSGMLAAQGESLLTVAIMYSIGSSSDAFDGWIARSMNCATRRGAYIDAISDKVGELGLIVGLALRTENVRLLQLLLLAAVIGLMGTYAKAMASQAAIRVNWSETKVFGRTIRVIIVGLGLAVVHLSGGNENSSLILLFTGLLVFNALVLISRILKAVSQSS